MNTPKTIAGVAAIADPRRIDFLNANDAEARALMESWLNIPAKVSPALRYPTGTPEYLRRNSPLTSPSRNPSAQSNTDPDVNSLVWQGP